MAIVNQLRLKPGDRVRLHLLENKELTTAIVKSDLGTSVIVVCEGSNATRIVGKSSIVLKFVD